MKAKNKNGKKKKIQLNYEADNMFITSIKNGQMKVIGYVDENNFSDFVNRYLMDILGAIPTKSLGLVESYIKRRLEEKPIVNNEHAADNHARLSEVFSNEQIKYIEQFLKGYSDVSIDDMCFGKPTEIVACFIISEEINSNIIQINLGYFDNRLDAFMFQPATNGKIEEECRPILCKVLGYIPFNRKIKIMQQNENHGR